MAASTGVPGVWKPVSMAPETEAGGETGIWPIVTNGACSGDRLLSALRVVAEEARRRLGSGLEGDVALPTSASMNLSAAEMLLTVAALKDSDLTIVVATAAVEAGTIAEDEAEPGASMD